MAPAPGFSGTPGMLLENPMELMAIAVENPMENCH